MFFIVVEVFYKFIWKLLNFNLFLYLIFLIYGYGLIFYIKEML